MLVTADNATFAKEHCRDLWLIDASDLQIKPGHTPKTIPTNLGNSQPFVIDRAKCNAEYLTYMQQLGCIELRVYSD